MSSTTTTMSTLHNAHKQTPAISSQHSLIIPRQRDWDDENEEDESGATDPILDVLGTMIRSMNPNKRRRVLAVLSSMVASLADEADDDDEEEQGEVEEIEDERAVENVEDAEDHSIGATTQSSGDHDLVIISDDDDDSDDDPVVVEITTPAPISTSASISTTITSVSTNSTV